jgi:signal transduction histidine kinase
MFNIFKRYIKYLSKPANTDDEDLYRKEYIFNISLLTLISLIGVHLVILIFTFAIKDERYDGIPLVLMVSIFIFYSLLLFLSKKGYSKIGIKIFVASISLIVLTTQLVWGFDFPSAILMWTLIVVTVSILINPVSAVVISILITALSFLSIHFQDINPLASTKSWKDYDFTVINTIEYGFIFLSISAICWLSNREIYKSLDRARRSERELKIERDNLDETVKKKSIELQEAQLEKINHMYRLVEFGRLSSGLFHDLSSPLSTMAMEISDKYKKSGYGTSGSLNDNLNNLIQSTQKIHLLIEKAKKQMRIDDRSETFSITKEVSDVLSILKTKARKVGVELVFNQGRKYNFTGNSVIFSHIINNLVSNAIDSYSDINDTRERKVFIWVNNDSNKIKITIKDFGIGMDTDLQEKIFEPFFTTKKLNGCGIGLSATKHNLEKYFEGTIRVISKVGAGSTFELLIPKNTLNVSIGENIDKHYQTPNPTSC